MPFQHLASVLSPKAGLTTIGSIGAGEETLTLDLFLGKEAL
jgi:hypothetical protein